MEQSICIYLYIQNHSLHNLIIIIPWCPCPIIILYVDSLLQHTTIYHHLFLQEQGTVFFIIEVDEAKTFALLSFMDYLQFEGRDVQFRQDVFVQNLFCQVLVEVVEVQACGVGILVAESRLTVLSGLTLFPWLTVLSIVISIASISSISSIASIPSVRISIIPIRLDKTSSLSPIKLTQRCLPMLLKYLHLKGILPFHHILKPIKIFTLYIKFKTISLFNGIMDLYISKCCG